MCQEEAESYPDYSPCSNQVILRRVNFLLNKKMIIGKIPISHLKQTKSREAQTASLIFILFFQTKILQSGKKYCPLRGQKKGAKIKRLCRLKNEFLSGFRSVSLIFFSNFGAFSNTGAEREVSFEYTPLGSLKTRRENVRSKENRNFQKWISYYLFRKY